MSEITGSCVSDYELYSIVGKSAELHIPGDNNLQEN
jgi:hypothetical protein